MIPLLIESMKPPSDKAQARKKPSEIMKERAKELFVEEGENKGLTPLAYLPLAILEYLDTL